MVDIKLEWEWFLIEKKVLFWATQPHPDYVNLALEVWEDVVTERLPHAIIEYPWEYDIMWIWAKVFLWKDNKLNYLLNIDWKKIWIIQTPKILEEDEVTGMDWWLYLDDAVEKRLDQLEMVWKKLKLVVEDWQLEIEEKWDNASDETVNKVEKEEDEE
jgi:hypothetical protein